MKLASLRVPPRLAALLLATGCASLNPFASSKPKPAELVDFKPSVELVALWRADIGEAGPYLFEPAVVGRSRVTKMSLCASGTPSRGLRSPAARRASAALACASAASSLNAR